MSFFTNNVCFEEFFFMKRAKSTGTISFAKSLRHPTVWWGSRDLTLNCFFSNTNKILIFDTPWVLDSCLISTFVQKTFTTFGHLSDFANNLIRRCTAPAVQLFVDSGVDLGGNDSLFSTGGKNGAKNVPAIWGCSFAFISDISIGNF